MRNLVDLSSRRDAEYAEDQELPTPGSEQGVGKSSLGNQKLKLKVTLLGAIASDENSTNIQPIVPSSSGHIVDGIFSLPVHTGFY